MTIRAPIEKWQRQQTADDQAGDDDRGDRFELAREVLEQLEQAEEYHSGRGT